VFGWFKRRRRDDVVLSMIRDGRRTDLTAGELALGNKLAADALLAVLAEKGLVDPAEVQARIRELRERHWRPAAAPADGDSTADPARRPPAEPEP
jgi:hypothetical protein